MQRYDQEQMERICHPRFDRDTGLRMTHVRVHMLMDQKELGFMLGVSQQQISKLETGRVALAPFSIATMRAVFSHYLVYILFGQSIPGWDPRKRFSTYLNRRLKTEADPLPEGVRLGRGIRRGLP